PHMERASHHPRRLLRLMSGLVARADSELDSQSKPALTRSAREAVELVLLEPDAVNVQMKAARHANEAYRWALHATRTAPLGAAVPAEREFQVKVREVFDALRKNALALHAARRLSRSSSKL